MVHDVFVVGLQSDLFSLEIYALVCFLIVKILVFFFSFNDNFQPKHLLSILNNWLHA